MTSTILIRQVNNYFCTSLSRTAANTSQTLTTSFHCAPPPVAKILSAFEKLPPELKNMIFGYLDECTSTCLGLTCRDFYAIHRSFHRAPTDFSSVTFIPNPNPIRMPTILQLWELLEVWMADQGFRFRKLSNGCEDG